MRKIILLFVWLSFSVSAQTQNLVAYYTFNGNANDQSGNAINPTYIGSGVTLTTDRFGNSNRAFNFDGTAGSYMRMPADLLPTTNRTISFWFNVPDVSLRPGLLGYGGNGSCGTTLLMGLNLLGSGQYYVQGHCGANAAGYSYPASPINSWYHWVLTINGSAQKIYVNGQLKSTDNTYSGSTAVTGKDLALGAITKTDGTAPHIDVNVGYLTGKLDEVRIYDNALTDAQVLQLYKNESTGLVAYYPFNGNANDESGNGNNGTVNGATLSMDRFGNTNKAYSFNGSNSFISVADNPALFSDELTLSWWYKVPEYSGTRVVIGWISGGNRYQQFFSGNNLAYFNGYYNSCCYFNPAYSNMTAVNQWQHVAVTYKKINTSESVTRLYINGELRQTDNHAAAITYQPGATFFIGKTHDCCNFNGELDDIRVYKRLLSPNEILQLADVPMQPELLVYLPLNDNANDMSGNGFHGTAHSGVLTSDKYGNNNSAYSFPALSNKITLDNSVALDLKSGFTISSWVKYSNISPRSAIVAKHNCGFVNGFIWLVENNQLRLYMANGGSWEIVGTAETFNDNKWHHGCVVNDGTGNVMIYVDGMLKTSGIVNYNNYSSALLTIGNVTGGCADGNFNGSIDEVKMYGSPMDAAQVMALYKQSRGSGKALAFQKNSTNHMNIGIISPPPSFSIEAWIKKNAVSGSLSKQYIFAGKNTNSLGFGVEDNISTPNRLFLELIGGAISYGPAMPNLTNNNKWHHVSVRYIDASTPVLFTFDGIELTGSSTIPAGSSTDEYSIGSRFESGNSFDGSIDEVRLWGAALSLQQIRDWKNRKITNDHPAINDFGYYYNFDEPSINKAYDSRNGATGQLINGPSFVTSGAAVGDAGIHNLANPSVSATLTLSTGDNFSVQQSVGTALGVSVYQVKDAPENQVGILGLGSNDYYFGVEKVEDYSGGITALYGAIYNYSGNPLVSSWTEPTLQLYKRADNSAASWTNSGATLNTTANTLTVTGQNTEYILGSSGFGLPVALLNFQAQKLNVSTTKLSWQTATEINNKGFEVQRSFDGNYFTGLQFVNGAGNSNDIKEYSITDVPGRTGRVFYRLEQIDFDGNSKLSNIESVLFDRQGIIRVYPNPARQNITVEGIDAYNRVQLSDATGKLIKEVANHQQYQLNINLSGVKSGLYYIRLKNEKETKTLALIIQQ